MLKPCAVCHAESIYFISLDSSNEDPVGVFWFCTYEHLVVWLTDKLWKRAMRPRP